jgi:phosphoribosyl 1,2-cyclic phosphate phosphodiesterase
LLKVTFLGTGTSQGVPVIACSCEVCQSADPRDNRLRTSILIEDKDTTLVIDSGPDFRQQLLRAGVKKLDGLVLTHEHKDHIAGMDDIRAFNYILNRSIDIYATERVQTALKREFYYAFDEHKYPGVPELNLITIDEQPFKAGTIRLQPLPVLHYRLPVLGFRVKNFSYITDAKTITPECMELLKGTEILVLNALRREPHISHFTLEEAIKVIEEVKPKKAYLTHLSHQMGKHEDLEKELPDGIECAFDGLELFIGK